MTDDGKLLYGPGCTGTGDFTRANAAAFTEGPLVGQPPASVRQRGAPLTGARSDDVSEPDTGGSDERWKQGHKVFAPAAAVDPSGHDTTLYTKLHSTGDTALDDMGVNSNERLVRMNCCSLAMQITTVGLLAVIAVFMAQDGETVLKLQARVNAYMDRFDEARVMETMADMTLDYATHVRPEVVHSTRSMRRLATFSDTMVHEATRDKLMEHFRDFILETQEWQRRVDRLLNRTAFHFNIVV